MASVMPDVFSSVVNLQSRHTDLVCQIVMPRSEHTYLVDENCMLRPQHTYLEYEICMLPAKNTVLEYEICMPRFEIGYIDSFTSVFLQMSILFRAKSIQKLEDFVRIVFVTCLIFVIV